MFVSNIQMLLVWFSAITRYSDTHQVWQNIINFENQFTLVVLKDYFLDFIIKTQLLLSLICFQYKEFKPTFNHLVHNSRYWSLKGDCSGQERFSFFFHRYKCFVTEVFLFFEIKVPCIEIWQQWNIRWCFCRLRLKCCKDKGLYSKNYCKDSFKVGLIEIE